MTNDIEILISNWILWTGITIQCKYEHEQIINTDVCYVKNLIWNISQGKFPTLITPSLNLPLLPEVEYMKYGASRCFPNIMRSTGSAEIVCKYGCRCKNKVLFGSSLLQPCNTWLCYSSTFSFIDIFCFSHSLPLPFVFLSHF